MLKAQRGIISGIEILVIVLVVAAVASAGVAIVHTYNRAIAENEKLKTDNAALTEAHQDQLVENAGLIARQDLLDKQMATRQASDQRYAALERKVNEELGKLYAQSPEALKWSAAPIDGGVRRSVRQRAAGGAGSDQDKAGAAAAAVVKPDARPAVPRSDGNQRRPLGVRPAAGVQPK